MLVGVEKRSEAKSVRRAVLTGEAGRSWAKRNRSSVTRRVAPSRVVPGCDVERDRGVEPRSCAELSVAAERDAQRSEIGALCGRAMIRAAEFCGEQRSV